MSCGPGSRPSCASVSGWRKTGTPSPCSRMCWRGPRCWIRSRSTRTTARCCSTPTARFAVNAYLEPWREAARTSPHGWHTVRRDEHSVGTSLRDAFGQPAGSLVWTRQETRDPTVARKLLVEVLLIAAATAALAFASGGAMEHVMRSRRARDLARLQALDAGGGDAIALAARVISAARAELSHVDREAHRVAGIET